MSRKQIFHVAWLVIVIAILVWVTFAVVGCESVPVLDETGQPTGETKLVWDRDATNAAAGAAAPFLPPPFNLLVPAVVGVATMVRKKEQPQ